MHRKKNSILFLLTRFTIFLIIILLLSSCRSTLSSDSTSQVTAPPEKNGEISLYMTMPDDTNPLLTSNKYWRDYSFLCFDPLISLDSEYKSYKSIALSWAPSEDKLAWIITINKDIKWHDENILSIDDVIFSLNTVIKNTGSFYYTSLKNIKSVEKVSEDTLQISLNTPDSFTPEKLFFPVIPKSYYSTSDTGKDADFKPIGSGPYKFNSYDKGQKLVLSQNPDWHTASDQFKDKNIPYINTINLNISTGTPANSVEAFNSGTSDILLADKSDISKYIERGDVGIFKYNTGDFSYIAFNLNSNTFKTSNFRSGIAYAIDPRRASEAFLQDAGYTAFALQPQNFLNTFLKNNAYYNPEKAKNFFSKEGWETKNGKMYKGGNIRLGQFQFRLLVNGDNPEKVLLANSIKMQLQEIGVIGIVIQQPWAQYKSMIDSGSGWDAAIMSISLPEIPDISILYSSESEFNTVHYSNPEVDKLLKDLINAGNTDEKGKIISDINSKVITDMPYVGLYFDNAYTITAKKIKGELDPLLKNKFNGIVKVSIPVINQTQ